jgi:Mg2+/Co2+ transporter CorC
MPEYETNLDSFKGNGRNHDMIVVGETAGKRTLISIEAKVDETFGEIVSEYVTKSRMVTPRTKVPDRVEQLSSAVFGRTNTGMLRYLSFMLLLECS